MITYFGSVSAIDVKNLNKLAVIDLVRFTPGGMPRVELARRLGLTRAAVTVIVNDLLELGIVLEAERRETPSGRKPVVLEINPQVACVVGIDIGSHHIRAIIADASAQVLAEAERPLDISNGAENCLYEVDLLLRDLLKEAGLEIDGIQAGGIGLPGPVVTETGMIASQAALPGWFSYPIQDHLQTLWGFPVSVHNDSGLAALGEWAYGAGRGEKHLIYIKVGTSIEAGLLLNNQIYQGAEGIAGEIGHIAHNEDGPVCVCGHRGCLDAVASGWAIAYQAREAVRKGHRTQLSSIAPTSKITSMDVITAARSGDLLSQQLISDAGGYLGFAVANVINVFNPGLIIVGGHMAQVGDLLIDPIRQVVESHSLKLASHPTRITTALLGARSSAMGAVVQALSTALRQKASGKEVRDREGFESTLAFSVNNGDIINHKVIQ